MAHPIPYAQILGEHLAIVGRTGAGKTYTAKGFVEWLLGERRRVCVIDPTGAWWGLRSAFPVAIFGGEHADVPIGPAAGEALAKVIAERNLPAIIDLSELLIGERHKFVTDFAEALYRLNRQPLHLVIDEADEVAPQNPLPETRRLLHQIDRIVRRGRIRGFRVMLITQRPAVLHKNVLTQANALVALRLTAPQDRNAILEWVKGQADAAQAKRVLDSLARLQRGEGWIWAPEHDLLERVKFPPIATFDSSRSPEDGDDLAEPIALAQVDLTEIRAALEPVEEAPGPKTKVAQPDATLVEAARREGYARGKMDGYAAAISGVLQLHGAVVDALEPLERQIAKVREETAKLASWAERAAKSAPDPVPAAPKPAPRPAAPAGSSGLGAERRILAVLAQRHPARYTEAQWATLAGMKRTGGTWGTYKSRLRTAGLIETDGKTWGATAAGIAAAGALPPAPSSPAEIIAMWRQAVGGAGRMLDALARRYPAWTRRTELADMLGMAVTGGTFGTYLSRLRSNGLIEEDGTRLRASAVLFGD